MFLSTILRFRRGFSYKALKKYTEAAEDFEAAKEFEPDDPRLVLDYANPKVEIKVKNINFIAL